jgi:hypothetical protein
MAKPARMLNIRDALMKIAARYDALADEREQECRRPTERAAVR